MIWSCWMFAGLTSIADYFIPVLGPFRIAKCRASPRGSKKMPSKRASNRTPSKDAQRGHWVLADFSDVIVHVFYEPVREFCDLDAHCGAMRRGRHMPEAYVKLVRAVSDRQRAACLESRRVSLVP